MKRSRFSEEQAAYALWQAESGTPVGGVCCHVDVSEATSYQRKAHRSGLELSRDGANTK